MEKDLETYGPKYAYGEEYMKLHNIFVETDPIGKVEETGLIRAVLVMREEEVQARSNGEGDDNGSSDEDSEGKKMVFMWIERWDGAETEEGAQSGLMMSRREGRPVGKQWEAERGEEKVVEEYTESDMDW